MSTQRYLVGELSRKGSSNQDSNARWDLSIHFVLHAEIRSVFYALTLPEYIEAWIRAPASQTVSALQQGSEYAIRFRQDQAPPIEVRGSWLRRYPRHIKLTWNRSDALMQVESIVSIELQPSAGGTLLRIYHHGFTAAEQSLWHGKLWSASVYSLAALLGSARNGPGARICAVSSLHRAELLKQEKARVRRNVRLSPSVGNRT